MKRNSALSRTLHALLHMAEQDSPMTSELLATCMRTNPVVVRRTMSGLREAGFVRAEKGHGGGWIIACDLRLVTLHDVYIALNEPLPFATHIPTESPGCVIEQIVNITLDTAHRDAEALLVKQLNSVTLADLAKEFHGHVASGLHRHKEKSHVI